MREMTDADKLELLTRCFVGHLMTVDQMSREDALELIGEMVDEFRFYDEQFKVETVQ